MIVCKLRQDACMIAIDKENFEAATEKRPPWYQNDNNGESLQYAICPACNNPIQIIALYNRSKNSPRPYGKHIPKSIYGLATYVKRAYETCPYANNRLTLNKESFLKECDPKGERMLHMLRDNFDVIVSIIQEDTGIVFSSNLAKSMLESFLAMRGHLYMGTNPCNLPWMFAYMTTSHKLFGRKLLPTSKLRTCLEKQTDIAIIGDQIKSPSGFLDISFAFISHKVPHNSTQPETIDFIVSNRDTRLLTQTIEVRPLLLQQRQSGKRSEHLLKIADELIPKENK